MSGQSQCDTQRQVRIDLWSIMWLKNKNGYIKMMFESLSIVHSGIYQFSAKWLDVQNNFYWEHMDFNTKVDNVFHPIIQWTYLCWLKTSWYDETCWIHIWYLFIIITYHTYTTIHLAKTVLITDMWNEIQVINLIYPRCKSNSNQTDNIDISYAKMSGLPVWLNKLPNTDAMNCWSGINCW